MCVFVNGAPRKWPHSNRRDRWFPVDVVPTGCPDRFWDGANWYVKIEVKGWPSGIDTLWWSCLVRSLESVESVLVQGETSENPYQDSREE